MNKLSLVTTPYVITLAATREQAERQCRKVFDKSLYDLGSCMRIQRKGAIVISEFTLYDIHND